MTSDTKKPVILLTGFLGSGKTTFLNQVLRDPEFSNSLVIVNEFGETPIDHHLVEKSDDSLLELSNGCLCCSVRGEMIETLASLPLQDYDRVIIETTGIADPLPIFQSLSVHPFLSQHLKPASIVCVFDVLRGISLIENYDDAMRQLSIADTIVLTKSDLLEGTSEAPNKISNFNSSANVVEANNFDANRDLEIGVVEKSNDNHLANPHHSHQYVSGVLESYKRLSLTELAGFLTIATNQLGDDLLRIKGFAYVSEHETPVIVQVSGSLVHDFTLADGSPDAEPKTQLVFIGRNHAISNATKLFDGFFQNASIDSPDREALINNPLSLSGF